jgi:hypothetical protein
MRRLSNVVTIVITSSALTLAGLVASPIATASENESVRVSSRFAFGSPLLTKTHKAAIEKAVTTFGTDATFIVTAEAGKLPGVSDSEVQLLAIKRGQVFKSYLVKLGVNKSSVTIKVKMTRLGIVPKTKIAGSYAAPVVMTAPAVAAPALTCATGGTCRLGDRGPGGGIVFYVSAANFTSTGSACGTACKYLEVAPATWQDTETTIDPIYTTVANDLRYQLSNTRGVTGQVLSAASPTESGFTDGATPPVLIEQENWKIGQGFNNTRIIKVTSATSAAQAAVLLYAGNSTAGQWFIPSMNELNELCKYARGQTTGGLTVPCDTTGTLKTGTVNDLGGFGFFTHYWSSSEYDADLAWDVDFFSGAQRIHNKGAATGYVRPVRAF